MNEDVEGNLNIRALIFFRKMHQLKRSFSTLRGEGFEHPNLTHDQMMITTVLAHMGKMKISDISEEVGLSMSTVSGILDRLEEMKIIKRVRSDEDRRVVFVVLEEKFKKKMDKMRKEMESKMDIVLGRITEEEMETIFKAIDILNRAIGE
ncbi:MAG: MarR family transcriptional regulator [Candidatus Methanofastidiosa archaeon]|nr:MarR family transcriptional regulator [Candidatus Methanofastidiosa archaeon]